MEERKRLLIVQEAMGGCGRNVVDIVNGIDHSKFDVTVAYGTSRMDDYYRNAIPEMDQHATLIPVPELVRDLSMSNDVKPGCAYVGSSRKSNPTFSTATVRKPASSDVRRPLEDMCQRCFIHPMRTHSKHGSSPSQRSASSLFSNVCAAIF